jgi:integrase/recombinase XerD
MGGEQRRTMDEIKLHQFAEKLELLHYSKRVVADYPATVRQFFEYLDEKESVERISDVRPEHITAYQTYLQFGKTGKGRRLSAKSIASRLGALKAFYRVMHREGLITTDLSEEIQLPVVRRHLPRHVPSAEEVRRILEAADVSTPLDNRPVNVLSIRDRAMLEFMYATAIRSEELRTIKLDDYDMAEHRVFIHGKGSKDRIVPVGPWVAPYVSRYLEESRPKLLRPSCEERGILFISKNGLPLNRNALWYMVQRYAKKAGAAHIMPHAFRHACATHLLHNGADIRIVQELLGHRSLASTQIYTKVDIHHLQQAHGKFHPRERW